MILKLQKAAPYLTLFCLADIYAEIERQEKLRKKRAEDEA